MKQITNRALALALSALLVLVLLAPNALAAAPEPAADLEPAEAVETAETVETAEAVGSEEEPEAPEEPEPEEDAELLAETAYTITVDGVSFLSNTARTGDGWNYGGKRLNLTGYDGGPIRSEGALELYTSGDVTITGTRENNLGGDALYVNGDLELNVVSGTLTVLGGSGADGGGHALRGAKNVELWLMSDSAAAVFRGGAAGPGKTGGDGISVTGTLNVRTLCDRDNRLGAPDLWAEGGGAAQTAAKSQGGLGLRAKSVVIQVPCELTGGDGITAGAALYAETVELLAPCDLTGGDGTTGGAALSYKTSCALSLCDMDFHGGHSADNKLAAAIVRATGGKAIPSVKHTTLSGKDADAERLLRVNEYTLTLNGNGGTRGGEKELKIKERYPSSYRLSDYLFTYSGQTQYAWKDGSGVQHALNEALTLEKDQKFTAQWIQTKPGDVLLNGHTLRFTSNGSTYKRFQSTTAVTLPDKMYYNSTAVTALAWGDAMNSSADDSGLASGSWYVGNDKLTPNKNAVICLYAADLRCDSTIIYHPTQGTLNGGTVLVQRITVETGGAAKLTVKSCDERMTAPVGKTLAGWAVKEGGEVRYQPGDEVEPTKGTPLQLYAVWKDFEYVFRTDRCTVWLNPYQKTLRIDPSSDWRRNNQGAARFVAASYRPNGRMIAYEIAGVMPTGGITVRYEGENYPLVRLFALDRNGRPSGNELEIRLYEMYPSLG